jgi:hypothetical protein
MASSKEEEAVEALVLLERLVAVVEMAVAVLLTR